MPLMNLLATGTTTAVTSSDWSALTDALTAQINVASVMGVLAAAAGISIGLTFAWWGARKTTKMVMAAFKKGRINF